MIKNPNKLKLWTVKKLSVILLLLFILGCNQASSDMLVVVPRLVNLNTETANRIASEFGITLEVIEEKYSEYVPKGSIISQTPIEDELIKSSRPVSIVVSKGRGKSEMPNLVGMSFYEAQKKIISERLKLGSITEVESTSNVVGVIEDQFPAPGAMVGRDTPVNLEIAVTSYSVMPDLIGLTPEEAVELIGQSGFNAERIRQKYITDMSTYSSTPGGYVVRQDPEAGMRVDSENPIDLYIKP